MSKKRKSCVGWGLSRVEERLDIDADLRGHQLHLEGMEKDKIGSGIPRLLRSLAERDMEILPQSDASKPCLTNMVLLSHSEDVLFRHRAALDETWRYDHYRTPRCPARRTWCCCYTRAVCSFGAELPSIMNMAK